MLAASAGPVGQCGQREASSKALWASRSGRFREGYRRQFVLRRCFVEDRLVQGEWGQVGGGRKMLSTRASVVDTQSFRCALGRPQPVPIRRQRRHCPQGHHRLTCDN